MAEFDNIIVALSNTKPSAVDFNLRPRLLERHEPENPRRNSFAERADAVAEKCAMGSYWMQLSVALQ